MVRTAVERLVLTIGAILREVANTGSVQAGAVVTPKHVRGTILDGF